MLSSLRNGKFRPIFASTQKHFPYLYWKARNHFDLVRWYFYRFSNRISGTQSSSQFDEKFWEFHNWGDWDGFAKVLVSNFNPRSILDVGCGQGTALEALKRIGGLRIKGLDHSPVALKRARAKGLDVSELDVTLLSKLELTNLTARLGDFDLVMCLEVAEHIPSWHEDKLLQLLTNFRTVIFSAAHPNQGGVLHVNEQPPSYWVRKFGERKFRVSDKSENFKSQIGKLNLPSWYRQNINIFEKL